MRGNPTIWLSLILPMVLVPLAFYLAVNYIAVDGRMKYSGIIIQVLVVALFECVGLFIYRCVQLYRRRRGKKG
jgi:hypothetical protein